MGSSGGIEQVPVVWLESLARPQGQGRQPAPMVRRQFLLIEMCEGQSAQREGSSGQAVRRRVAAYIAAGLNTLPPQPAAIVEGTGVGEARRRTQTHRQPPALAGHHGRCPEEGEPDPLEIATIGQRLCQGATLGDLQYQPCQPLVAGHRDQAPLQPEVLPSQAGRELTTAHHQQLDRHQGRHHQPHRQMKSTHDQQANGKSLYGPRYGKMAPQHTGQHGECQGNGQAQLHGIVPERQGWRRARPATASR